MFVDHYGISFENANYSINANGKITVNGQTLPVRCGNHFGLEGKHEWSEDPVNPGGAPMELYTGSPFYASQVEQKSMNIRDLVREIKSLGINTVRIPIAPQTLDPNDPQGQKEYWKTDEQFQFGENSLGQLKEYINALKSEGLYAIVDIHSCSNYLGWRAGRLDDSPFNQISGSFEGWSDEDRGVYYDAYRSSHSCLASDDGKYIEDRNGVKAVTVSPYNKAKWLENLKAIARLSLDHPNIMAIDIFNEPHGYTKKEWQELVRSAWQAISSVNQNILIMVEGIGAEARGVSQGQGVEFGDINPNWGGNLYGFGAENPFPGVPKNKLLLSPHAYGPSVSVQAHFLKASQNEACLQSGQYDELKAGRAGCIVDIEENRAKIIKGFQEHWGYLADAGYGMLLGEFGGIMDWPKGLTPRWKREAWGHQPQSGEDEKWQKILVSYLKDRQIPACHWAINPETGDTDALYTHKITERPDGSWIGWGIWNGVNQRVKCMLWDLWGLSSEQACLQN